MKTMKGAVLMTRTRFSILILAVLTALILAGCGSTDNSHTESSVEPGLQTFGVAVNPSAQPSTGEVLPEISATTTETTNVGGTGVATEDNAVASTAPSEAPTPTPSKTPSGSGSSTAAPSATVSPSSSPNIAPPAPVSTATADDVEQYIGKSFSQLVDDLGYPNSSSYDYVDEDDPSKGEIGTIYYSDFTVTTRRENGTETVTAVTPN